MIKITALKFTKRKLTISIIILLIVILAIVGLIIIFKGPVSKKAVPITKNPWGGCGEKIEGYDPKFDYKYNYVSALDITTEKDVDTSLIIGKDGEKRTFSLGKYKLNLEPDSIVFIPKLWLFFASEKLSSREDKLYGLEDSYLSKIIFKVGNYTKEVNFGKTGEHSFIELASCPIGNFDAVNYKTDLEFEFLLEIGCNNLKDGACLDNSGKPLDYIDGVDLLATIRFFVVSGEQFNQDLKISASFKY